jgi:hypothetical protein
MMCPECFGQGITTDPPMIHEDDTCQDCKGTGQVLDQADRRNIDPEFYGEVKRALISIGCKADPIATAKVLWTNTLIEARATKGDPIQTVANPHYLGGNVDKIHSTIRSMYWQ